MSGNSTARKITIIVRLPDWHPLFSALQKRGQGHGPRSQRLIDLALLGLEVSHPGSHAAPAPHPAPSPARSNAALIGQRAVDAPSAPPLATAAGKQAAVHKQAAADMGRADVDVALGLDALDQLAAFGA